MKEDWSLEGFSIKVLEPQGPKNKRGLEPQGPKNQRGLESQGLKNQRVLEPRGPWKQCFGASRALYMINHFVQHSGLCNRFDYERSWLVCCVPFSKVKVCSIFLAQQEELHQTVCFFSDVKLHFLSVYLFI
jgi:hypothetical protein